tara:strand:- start:2537 stop:3868 length:1332 start_codon:yes stop_codon:yes gene_type:complete
MEFFNRKEEVIDIQLTQYGKHLLSKGKFRPSLYAFFDDDVLYDIEYASGGEHQKDIEDRIKSTPRIKAQYNFSGRDLKSKKVDYDWCKGEMDQCNKLQVSKDKHYAIGMPIGNSELNSSRMPAWDVKVLTGHITGSTYYMQGTQEESEFTFTSDTASDYLNSATNTGKYIDLYSTSGKISRLHFTTTSTATYKPPANILVTLHAVAIDGLSSKTTIADKFDSVVSEIKEYGKKLFSTKVASNKVTITNTVYGTVTAANINSELTTVTVSQTTQGKSGSPKVLQIPQLDVNLKAFVRVASTTELGDEGDVDNAGQPTSYEDPMYPDGTYLSMTFEDLFLDVSERNSPSSNEQFDIEVFKIESDENGLEELIPLTFQKPIQQIVNGILLDPEEQERLFERESVGPESVDYFFDLAVDDEIDPRLGRVPSSIYRNRDSNQEEPCED